jgi:multisubunit Na+/H+ antiporter MnhC subunit
LDTLNKWIQEEEAKSFTHAFSLTSILVALTGVAIVLVILVRSSGKVKSERPCKKY